MIKLLAVESDAILAVGYDPVRKTLYIEWINHDIYAYQGVPPEEYYALLEAESVGAYANRHIKPHYPYREM